MIKQLHSHIGGFVGNSAITQLVWPHLYLNLYIYNLFIYLSILDYNNRDKSKAFNLEKGAKWENPNPETKEQRKKEIQLGTVERHPSISMN